MRNRYRICILDAFELSFGERDRDLEVFQGKNGFDDWFPSLKVKRFKREMYGGRYDLMSSYI